jgi:hypothetical protein
MVWVVEICTKSFRTHPCEDSRFSLGHFDFDIKKLRQHIPQPPKAINSSPAKLKLSYPITTRTHRKLIIEKSEDDVGRVPLSLGNFHSTLGDFVTHTTATEVY